MPYDPTKDKPVLEFSLDSIIESRKYVEIDGIGYAMKSSDELTMSQHAIFARNTQMLDSYSKTQLPTPEAGEEADAAVDGAVRIIMVDLPDEIRRALPYPFKVRIIEAYATQFLEARAAITAETPAVATGDPVKVESSPLPQPSSTDTQ